MNHHKGLIQCFSLQPLIIHQEIYEAFHFHLKTIGHEQAFA